MKTNTETSVHVIYSYGAWEIKFKKSFVLPCTPFIGLNILDEVDDNECHVELAENRYVHTMIYYYPKRNKFTVDVREHWNDPVTDDTIDDIIKRFTDCKWKRTDNTNINDLKELMLREYKRNQK